MYYVKASNNTVEKFPYSIGMLRKDNPNVSFPKVMSIEALAEWGVYPVTVVDNPDYDVSTQRIDVAELPTFVNGAWIIPKTVVDLTAEEVAAVKAKQVEMYTNAVQEHLDSVAKDRNYDGILSLCTYATSSNTTFAAEGQAGVAWRDSVWTDCYTILANVESGVRTQPTVEELVAELPTIVWPA